MTFGAELPDDGEAVFTGEHHVQDHRVVTGAIGQQPLERLRAVAVDIDFVTVGFEVVTLRDRTAEVLPALRENRSRLQEQGLPKLGLHALMGERIKDLQINVARGVEEGRLTVIEALVRKPE